MRHPPSIAAAAAQLVSTETLTPMLAARTDGRVLGRVVAARIEAQERRKVVVDHERLERHEERAPQLLALERLHGVLVDAIDAHVRELGTELLVDIVVIAAQVRVIE